MVTKDLLRGDGHSATLDVGEELVTIWNNMGFTENELSRPAKLIVGVGVAIILVLSAVTAAENAVHGVVPHPWCGGIIALGFLLFLMPKIQIVRRSRRFSFGTKLMTQNQANSYRVGYFLMVLGCLLSPSCSPICTSVGGRRPMPALALVVQVRARPPALSCRPWW